MSLGYRSDLRPRSDSTRLPAPCRPPRSERHDRSVDLLSTLVFRDAPLPAPDKHDEVPATRPIPFDLGRLYVTAAAMELLPPLEVAAALARHAGGDWGTLPAEDREANERALLNGDRLLSVYHTAAGVKFYVITEWDRSVTTVLLPEDY